MAHTLFTGQSKRERKRERERVRERELFLVLKGMTGALAPFSYLVSNKSLQRAVMKR